ncbi:hypothetical protein [Halostella sp. PRR32]|uniref:hypothetical protein n=1 Tax=Halostella sp. PRR32 TaxID=3098147 RepID=UPI002B1DD91E|nr:hypothetical protein [Halostella sp. PRR32]
MDNVESVRASGNGIEFPRTAAEDVRFERLRATLLDEVALDGPPIRNERWVIAPYDVGWPRYVRRPVFQPRPDWETLRWFDADAPGFISPGATAWAAASALIRSLALARIADETDDDSSRYRSLVDANVAELGLQWGMTSGQARLLSEDAAEREELAIVLARYDEAERESTPLFDAEPYLETLWAVSTVIRATERGADYGLARFVSAGALRTVVDAVATVIVNEFAPVEILRNVAPRALGTALAALATFVKVTGDDGLATDGWRLLRSTVALVEYLLTADGRVVDEDGGDGHNLAARQGAVGQGLVYASTVGIDAEDAARSVCSYLLDDLWNPIALTFASGRDADAHAISVRDAGDVIGGLHAAASLGIDGADDRFVEFYDNTFDRGRLQRAQRLAAADGEDQEPPLPTGAGGRYGQAPVYNGEVAYDSRTDEWRVTDERYLADGGLYLAAQILQAVCP